MSTAGTPEHARARRLGRLAAKGVIRAQKQLKTKPITVAAIAALSGLTPEDCRKKLLHLLDVPATVAK